MNSDRIPLYSMRVATLIFSDAEMDARYSLHRNTSQERANTQT